MIFKNNLKIYPQNPAYNLKIFDLTSKLSNLTTKFSFQPQNNFQMCGGRVELIPCSVVAHMFKSHTYETKVKSQNSVLYNNDRIAEIWLDDEYKKYYYRSVGDTKNRDYGNITERLELKKQLGCKSFKWFHENVHPNLVIAEYLSDETWKKKEEEEKKLNEMKEKIKKEQEERKQKKIEENKTK